MNSFLIVGANGQLGKALQAKYPEAQAVDSNELDITDPGQVASFDWSKVKIILNAAAYTNVDGAETPEGRVAAWQVNAVGAANLTKAALEHDLTLLHISTDYVFDGTKPVYTEDEPFSPLGVYGQSKAAGDVAVSLAPKHYILRASWVIGDGKNFVRTMLALGQKGVDPTVISDNTGRPTFTTELVRAIDHIIDHQASFGIYNVSNEGKTVSWADLTRAVFEVAGFELTVTDTTTEGYYANKPGSAPRPLNSIFNLSKIQATSFKSTDWLDDLKEYVKRELKT
ncbi:MAG TPA: NAD(P)-dependent oxidoreductase [Candidatus Saccharimonadales bacterium]|nr:NAD(P)-dependent oxidoreductase [Candidatus Saccharimonadales bacterium]